jgi:hypothetical protein
MTDPPRRMHLPPRVSAIHFQALPRMSRCPRAFGCLPPASRTRPPLQLKFHLWSVNSGGIGLGPGDPKRFLESVGGGHCPAIFDESTQALFIFGRSGRLLNYPVR